MTHTFHTVETADLDTQAGYRLVIGCVVPRPVAWITTVGATGLVNAAPFSSYNYVCHSPPMLAVNIGSKLGELKDTARNIVETGEFVVNVSTVDDLEPMHGTSADYPSEVSEPAVLGIDLLPSRHVKPPRIASSPVQMECRLVHTLPLGRGLNTLYIGEVVTFHLSSAVYDGRRVDSVKMRPIARLGGPFYATLGEIYNRPQLQLPPGTVKGTA